MIVKGNLLVDQYGNILRVTRVRWNREGKVNDYRVHPVISITSVFGFVTSQDVIEGRVRKATKNEVKMRMILYGPKR